MTLRETSRDEFVAHITENKADAFAKTFVAKADMQQQWQYCIGYWEGAAEGAPELLKKEMPLHRHAEKLLAQNGVSKDDPDYYHHLGNTIKHLRQFGNIDLINKQGVAEQELAGAIITTRSKKTPYVFNLQLLHTFAKHRRKGVARVLTQDSLDRAQGLGTSYYRVSAEPDAVVFYESMGFRFLGKQKSGCSLSMFKINGKNFADGIYDLTDPVIHAAVYKKGKGGCVEVY